MQTSDDLLERWEADGLHLDYARRVPGRNGLVVAGGGIERREVITYRGHSAAATLCPEDLEAVPWQLARWVFATGSTQALGDGPRHAIGAAFQAARARGCRVAYDPTLSADLWPGGRGDEARAALDEVAPELDVLVLSAPYATGKLLAAPRAEDAVRLALDLGVRAVVVRQGTRGCALGDSEGVRVVPPPRGSRGPTTSEADEAIFDAALLVALARGHGLDRAAAAGMRVAALSDPLAFGLAAVGPRYPTGVIDHEVDTW